MSRLLHPNRGDKIDRWTILELKIQDAIQRQHPHEHFLGEQREIGASLGPFLNHTELQQLSIVQQLQNVNKRIWMLQDQMAAWAAKWPNVIREQDIYEIADAGVLIYQLNEERNRLVQVLNQDQWTEKIR